MSGVRLHSCERLEARLCLSTMAFAPHVIFSTDLSSPSSMYSADLDGDGDVDFLTASAGDDTIAWYENEDGKGAFGPRLTITANTDEARSVYAADLDGDGDMDVLSASRDDDTVAWYENVDGLGSFGRQQVITTAADEPVVVYSTDIDGDGAWRDARPGGGRVSPLLRGSVLACAAL